MVSASKIAAYVFWHPALFAMGPYRLEMRGRWHVLIAAGEGLDRICLGQCRQEVLGWKIRALRNIVLVSNFQPWVSFWVLLPIIGANSFESGKLAPQRRYARYHSDSLKNYIVINKAIVSPSVVGRFALVPAFPCFHFPARQSLTVLFKCQQSRDFRMY